MNKPSKKLLDLTIDITGERELEEFPKLLKLYTYALGMEVEIERLQEENLLLKASEPMSKIAEDYGYKARCEKAIEILDIYGTSNYEIADLLYSALRGSDKE